MTSDDLLDLERRAREGDAGAFGQLARLYDHDLRGVVWSVVRSATGTDDVMQTAYEHAFRAISSFDGRSTMRTWLHTICYRAAIDHVRYESRRRHESVDDVPLVMAGAGPEEAALARAEVAAAFACLDSGQRVALMLTSGLGFSYDEAAEITGVSRGTVASRASRARARVERELGR